MPITTEDCKLYITNFYSGIISGTRRIDLRGREPDENCITAKNWKRKSKHGNETKGFIRVFENIKNGLMINVHSTNDTITELKLSLKRLPTETPAGSAQIILPSSNNLYGYIRRVLEHPDCTDISTSDLLHSMTWDTLPSVPTSEGWGTEPGDEEDIDFENNEIISLTPSRITVLAGGDWQEPLVFSAKYNRESVTHIPSTVEPGVYEDGMTIRQVLLAVYGTDNKAQLPRKIVEGLNEYDNW
jgi:hypothetical protein